MQRLRSAAALLRGAAQLALAPQRVVSAGLGAQAAAEPARRLDQGCGVRHATTAVGGEPAMPGGRGGVHAAAVGEAAPLARKLRGPRVLKRGEKTADGRPKPDERTVAYLVRPGWLKSEEEVVALLTRAQSEESRYPFETVKPAADWLEAMLGAEPVVRDLCPAARAVKKDPHLLTRDTATLQRNWDALTLSAEQGGVGIMFTVEEAREAVCRYPLILSFAVDNLRSGWSLLTATEGGLGLTHDEARKCILLNPRVLQSDFEKFTKRVELVRSLGYADAHRMVLEASQLLGYKDETVIEHADWWRQHTGLDHVKVVTSQPTLLGACSTTSYQAKVDFLRDVAGLSDYDLNHGAPFFGSSLEDKLRPRFFYAVQHGALERCKLSTLTFCSDAVFLRMVHRLDAPASADAVERYKETVSSAAFKEQAAQEARRRGGDSDTRDEAKAR